MNELPIGWCWLPLESFGAPEPHAITDGPFGSHLKTSDYVDGGEVRVIRLGNIGVGGFIDHDRSFVTAEKFAALTKHEARPGDLVIAALAEPVGRCVEVPYGLGRAMVKADCVRVRVKPEFDRRYLMHALNSPGGRARAEAAAHGMGRLRINLGDLRSLLVPTAPPGEQRRIVAKLEALQARSRRAREALDAVPPLLEKLRQSILAAAFRGDLTKDWRAKNEDVEPATELLSRIRLERRTKWEESELEKLKAKGKLPTDDKWKAKYKDSAPVDSTGLPELPKRWCWASAEELAQEVTVGHVGSMEHRYVPDGVPFLRSQNIRANRYDPSGLRFIPSDFHAELSKSRLAPGDLVVVRSGAPGTACVIPDELNEANCADLVIARLVSLVDPHVIAFYMNSAWGTGAVLDAQVGVAQQHFNVGAMRALHLPLMPFAEQTVLRERLTEALAAVRRLATRMTELLGIFSDLERSTLARAFRGELVPPDPTVGTATPAGDDLADAQSARRNGRERKRGTHAPSALTSGVANADRGEV